MWYACIIVLWSIVEDTEVVGHSSLYTVAYDTAYVTNKVTLQCLQTRTSRLIADTGPKAHHKDIFKQLDWLSLKLSVTSIIVFCRNNLAPQYLIDLVRSNGVNHTHSTRYSNHLWFATTTTHHNHNSVTMSGHRLWKELPDHIKHCISLPSLQRNLYKHGCMQSILKSIFIKYSNSFRRCNIG